MSPTYKRWIFHGDAVDLSSFLRSNSRFLGATFSNVSECREENVNLRENIGVRDSMDDELVEMIHDLHGPIFEECRRESNEQDEFDKISGMFPEIEEELYPGCLKFTSFNFLVKLMHIKVLNRWSDKSFDMLLELLNEAFPNGVKLPVSYYEAKKRLRDLGMGYESIHVCKFDCALFWKDYASLDKCPHCGESRYRLNDRKGKQISHKVLRYFPLKARMQRLFLSEHTAVDMRWHKGKRCETEGILRHPPDAEGWKHFDEQYPCFASDARNVRLALSSDGFNPFGNMSTSYSMWPVILIPYNLPPWKCMKAPFTFLSLLIPGLKSPGKEIDIYLQPLIDALNELWVDGIQTYDSFSASFFQLRAALLWTINDFPAYGDLSGWRTKGTILNIDGKTKDTIKAREDLANLKIRKELHIQEIGNKRVTPHASYTLSAAEKVDFCTFLKSVKFPDGFASNISRCVNLKEGKIYGLKSHDCHVLLQRLLPIDIRPYLRKDISTTISELSNFFHALCKKTLSISELDKMQDDIVLILCKLEKIFPPVFFDVMVHLAVHLPWEARIVGPVGYSWMYPIERSLRYLKQYVRNKARPEGSIAEAYVINESLNFCSMYLRGIETRWLGGAVFRQLTPDELEKSHWLHELAKHREHMRILESSNGNGDLYKRQQLEFPTWFKAKAQRLHCDKFISDDLYALACGPNDCARSYSGCIANGVRFHTKDRDSRRTTQNSGVMVPCDDSFILVSQAANVFYVDDYKLGQDWKIVQQIQPRHVWDIPDIESNELEVTSDETISTYYPIVEHNLDSQTFNREDVEPSIIGDQEDIIAQLPEEASTDEALVDEEDFDSNNSSDESMSDEDCDSY
ncbi:Transposon, En/Spm-like protein [Cucumis melo var. makuwa]|uniref:Transposon, En/Spm-like protein n=1 Tax=Cucumis melo var. makuwa TaxID=1194695 RepID=A0A5A7VNJ9_CUCMM|nr:Transposon, En/Spm-like protein [Cucumis melo var. makuwa]